MTVLRTILLICLYNTKQGREFRRKEEKKDTPASSDALLATKALTDTLALLIVDMDIGGT